MIKRAIKNGLEWVFSGVVGVAICVSLFLAVFVAISFTSSLINTADGAKAIYRLDLSRDDIYDAFSSVVTDLGTLKAGVDDALGSFGANITSLSTLSNETSADLTTDSTAITTLGNEVSADLTTDSTAVTALLNEITTDWVSMKATVDELRTDFNLQNVSLSWGNTITNATAASLGNSVVTPSARTAPIVNVSARTAPVVTPTAVSNTTGTLGTTTPTL